LKYPEEGFVEIDAENLLVNLVKTIEEAIKGEF
jgi:hypothetical protein